LNLISLDNWEKFYELKKNHTIKPIDILSDILLFLLFTKLLECSWLIVLGTLSILFCCSILCGLISLSKIGFMIIKGLLELFSNKSFFWFLFRFSVKPVNSLLLEVLILLILGILTVRTLIWTFTYKFYFKNKKRK